MTKNKTAYKTGLALPIQYLKNIGPKRALYLKRIGVETIEDFLFLVPRRYIDRTKISKIRELTTGQHGSVYGKIIATGTRKTKAKGNIVRIVVTDQTDILEAVWFNRPDLKSGFKTNQPVILSGNVTYYERKQMVNPFYEIITEDSDSDKSFVYTGSIIPIYPLTEGLSNWEIRRPMQNAINSYLHLIPESLSHSILNQYSFPTIKNTITNLHFPKNLIDAQIGQERLKFEEFFYLELILALRKLAQSCQQKGYTLPEKGFITSKFLKLLPFQLTQGQNKVLSQIKADMAKPTSMNRLLQGDVGSGKTVIAVYAMLIAIENAFQAALMAPTEILAEQHYLVWHDKLKELGIDSCLLTSSTKTAQRKSYLADIQTNKIKIIFGTHALIEQDIKFHKLGLAIIDEQHRFGVMQRAALINKGINPDFLVMTATPIPRTLQMTLYGDLEISVLAEKPPGRKRIITRLTTDKERDKIYKFIQDKITEVRQVYIVCPLIEESEKLDLKAAIKTYEQTSKIFAQFRVGLVHGKLKSSERINIMEQFRRHELDILVTTTVIEVGVDIANATVMVIEHPERFGLAQLHQLRGRIGRGQETSYCILIGPDSSFAPAMHRLKFFEQNDDGFLLAEKDLEIRGPGQLLGTRQHGLPDLRFADLTEDRALLFKARDEAFALIDADPNLSKPENQIIRSTFLSKFKDRTELLRVG
ncbi:MAG: ATP-dependent DNA helicase RecG [Candidatus Latescibacteria bacterium]|nr:ATP-dependent DNA helicase RecG [Candidatus Latescibacterota bacterium]